MIVCKKPFTIHDVDLMGLGVLLTLAAAAWPFVIAPYHDMWTNYNTLSAQRSAVESELGRDIEELRRFEQRLGELKDVITAETGAVPTTTALSRLLREMTAIAEESNLDIISVVPQPAVSGGAYLVSDIRVGARGASRDFVRFLDRLAQENPRQSLQACSITRAPGDDQPTCDLNWTLRLYLLPADGDNGEAL